MSNEAVKLTEKAGTSISKDKLLEAIRNSPNKQFTYSQSPRVRHQNPFSLVFDPSTLTKSST